MIKITNLTRRAMLGMAAGAMTMLASAGLAQDESNTAEVIELSLGSDDAPITLVEYASYTCPHCASFHSEVFPQIKENYIDTGKVRMIYRGVYFDRLGLWADMVARCAGPDRYFGMAKMIFEKQGQWTQGSTAEEIINNLYSMGRVAGMSNDDMEACVMNADMAKALVEKSQADMEADGIDATPMFVINGETVSNMSYEQFVTKFDELLQE